MFKTLQLNKGQLRFLSPQGNQVFSSLHFSILYTTMQRISHFCDKSKNFTDPKHLQILIVTDIRKISIFPTNLTLKRDVHPVIPTNGIPVVYWKSGHQGYLFALGNLFFIFLSARHLISGVIYIFLFSMLLFLFSDVAEFFTLRRRGLLKSDERVRCLVFTFFIKKALELEYLRLPSAYLKD